MTNKIPLIKCLEELHFLNTEFRKALARYQEQTGIKVSKSKQCFNNWKNGTAEPNEDTRNACLMILNQISKQRGLERKYTRSEVFPERPYEVLKAQDLDMSTPTS